MVPEWTAANPLDKKEPESDQKIAADGHFLVTKWSRFGHGLQDIALVYTNGIAKTDRRKIVKDAQVTDSK